MATMFVLYILEINYFAKCVYFLISITLHFFMIIHEALAHCNHSSSCGHQNDVVMA